MSRRIMFWITCLVLLLPQVAFACPTCAAAQETSTAFWIILISFILLPPLAMGVVASILWKHLRIERPLALAEDEPVPPSTRPPLRAL